MSSQSNSSVYSEKKIAAYEALFKESSFAKPQEVYLTVTVAHLFGQAYIMEQQGTKEGDPVYSRFVCPLEEITKVYINENAKSSPLFIQCDTDVKGVIHRKRIIVPCLDNVASIVAQIKEVQALHMEKYNAAQEKEKERKRKELEEKRKQEQIKKDADAAFPPLPAVEKLPAEAEIKSKPEPVPAPAPKAVSQPAKAPAPMPEEPAVLKKAAPVQAEPQPVKKPAPTKTDISSVEALNNEIAESMKALESFGNSFAKPQENKPEAAKIEEPVKPVKPLKPILDLDSIPDSVPVAPVSKPVPEPVKAAVPVIKEEPAPVIKEEAKPAPAPIPAPVQKEEPKPEPVKAAAPVQAELAQNTEPAPKPKPAPRVNPNGAPSALNDFEAEVRKLKALRDEGKLTAEEYAAEKKKLISVLY